MNAPAAGPNLQQGTAIEKMEDFLRDPAPASFF